MVNLLPVHQSTYSCTHSISYYASAGEDGEPLEPEAQQLLVALESFIDARLRPRLPEQKEIKCKEG
jgi:hypothetical protein